MKMEMGMNQDLADALEFYETAKEESFYHGRTPNSCGADGRLAVDVFHDA